MTTSDLTRYATCIRNGRADLVPLAAIGPVWRAGLISSRRASEALGCRTEEVARVLEATQVSEASEAGLGTSTMWTYRA